VLLKIELINISISHRTLKIQSQREFDGRKGKKKSTDKKINLQDFLS